MLTVWELLHLKLFGFFSPPDFFPLKMYSAAHWRAGWKRRKYMSTLSLFLPPLFISYEFWIHHFMIHFTLDCLLSSRSPSGFHLYNGEWNVEEIHIHYFFYLLFQPVVTNIFKHLPVVLYPVAFPTFCWKRAFYLSSFPLQWNLECFSQGKCTMC